MTDDLLDDDVQLRRYRRRGWTRIILGGLGLITAVTGLLKTTLIAALVAVVLAPLSAAPVSFGATTDTFEASPSLRYYVYVPSSDVASASCTAAGEHGARWKEKQIDLPAKIVNTEYTQIGSASVSADQQITITCTGVQDVAVTALGLRGTMLAFSSVLVSALALLSWGVVARVRSGRPEKPARHEWL